MGDIVIATTANAELIRDWLRREMSILSHEGLTVEFKEWTAGSDTFVACRCDNQERAVQEIFIYYVACALAGVIQSTMENGWMRRRLHRMYSDLTPQEVDDLTQRIVAKLTSNQGDGDGFPRARILLDLMDYIDANSFVHLEGFMRFRLKSYQQQLNNTIEDVVAAWVAEQEQEEFLDFLRYFIATQESQIDRVEVVLNSNGLFRLLDDDHNVVDNFYLEGFVADLVQGSVDNADLLISALITLAPKAVRCHFETDLPVVDTLRGIFLERLSFCPGCALCGGSHRRREESLPAQPTPW